MSSWSALLLSGGPRHQGVSASLGISTTNFPVADELLTARAWTCVLEDLGDAVGQMGSGLSQLQIFGREQISEQPRTPMSQGWEAVVEPRSPRGVAGVISDIVQSDEYRERLGDWLLVIESSGSPHVDVQSLFRATELPTRPSLIFGISELDRPCGVYLVRREIYDLVPKAGFFDFKEQLISRMIDEGLRIETVVVSDRAHRLDTREGWLAIVEAWSRKEIGGRLLGGSENMGARREGACVIRPSAVVRDATVISSIILDDVVIEPGAVVARSIVARGSTVKAGSTLVDAVYLGSR